MPIPIHHKAWHKPRRAGGFKAAPRTCSHCSASFAPRTVTLVYGGRRMSYVKGTSFFCSRACARASIVQTTRLHVLSRDGIDPDLAVNPNPATRAVTRTSFRTSRRKYVHLRLLEAYFDDTPPPPLPRFLNLETATVLGVALMAKPDMFSPQQAAELRSRILEVVSASLPDVATALSTDPNNKRHMTNAQVSLFKTLLGKVVPDLNASYSVTERRRSTPEQLTREELEALASGEITDIEIVESTNRRLVAPVQTSVADALELAASTNRDPQP